MRYPGDDEYEEDENASTLLCKSIDFEEKDKFAVILQHPKLDLSFCSRHGYNALHWAVKRVSFLKSLIRRTKCVVLVDGNLRGRRSLEGDDGGRYQQEEQFGRATVRGAG